MELFDLSAETMLAPLETMLRELTRDHASREALTSFIMQYGKHRPVEQWVSVVPEPDVPGGYRIRFDRPTAELSSAVHVAWMDVSEAERAALPVRTGGLIGSLIATKTPKLATNLSIADDPHLSAGAKKQPSCMALPVYRGTEIEEWTLGFSSRTTGFSSRDVIQGLITTNILAVANRQIDTMQEISRLNRRMRDQIDQIARLQQALLPNQIPEVPGVEIATSYLASELAGGDYYDFFALPNDNLGVMIADVSGHGAAAAAVMAMLHAIMHCYEPRNGRFSPAEALAFANRRMYHSGLEGQFVTAFLGVLDSRTGRLTYSNAGHPPPIIKSVVKDRIWVIDGAATLPLGITEDAEHEEAVEMLEPLDTLLLYTDGITEAFNAHREMFGMSRLRDSVINCSGAPDCAVDHVHSGLFKHRGESTRDDDQTLVAVRFHGVCAVPAEEPAMSARV